MAEFYGDYEIICPYCFFRFSHDQAIFRSNTGFDQSELDLGDNFGGGGLLGGNQFGSVSDSRHLFRKFDDETSFSSDKKLDTALIHFWKELGGSSGYIHMDKRWNYPHIDPSKPEEFREMISYEPAGRYHPGPDGFVRDRDGFIIRVLDKYSAPHIPMTRLCPECHNPLPLPDYGKYPVIFISVVGVTGAGKTVYLNQLLTKFSEVVAGTGYRVGPNNLDAVGESVCPGSPLPGSTDDKMMRRPLAVSLLSKDPNSPADGLTIVFYDIAGENCVNEQGNPDTARAKSTIGHFIASCHGLIFLIDPEQLPPFATGSIVRPSDIGNVVSVMSVLRQMNDQESTWDNVPVAVTIAKSDKLRNCASIDKSNPIFSYGNQADMFDRDEIMGIGDYLSTFLNSNAKAVIAPLDSFRRQSFFAVSAITCGVESRFEKYQNMYILDNENEHLFYTLRRWVEGWNRRTPENRQYYMKCPVQTKDGQEISFPYDTVITKQNAAGLITEVVAVSTHADPIYLSLWDCAAEVNLTSYPVADPSPRRVGDPLKWILWKRGLIGPYFNPELPRRKKAFESRKHYDEYLVQLETQNFVNSRLFYGEKLEEY